MSSFKFNFTTELDEQEITDDNSTDSRIPLKHVEPHTLENADTGLVFSSVEVVESKTLKLIGAERDSFDISNTKLQKILKSSDLEKNVYEGGLKIWEGTFDLIRYLSQNKETLLASDFSVLELGCGHGVVLTYLLKSLNITPQVVLYQDLNEEVLRNKTIPTCRKNVSKENFKKCTFVAGDWAHFNEENIQHKFGLILSSETVYDVSNFASLVKILKHFLKEEGVALFSAKRFYFGVGGGSSDFVEYIENKEKKYLSCQIIQSFEDGQSNIRDIIQITSLSSNEG
eukprot:snap_masked-scaffold_27-processed-gene-0.14-mRNA-1 protein AED:0.22 eAED:0.23 QI:0/-1/0/1/-1/1/1/0/284